MHIHDIQVVRTTSSLLSFVASATIATMIFRSQHGLHNSFSRILFGLSISDIMVSASIIAMALAVPRDQFSNAPWAIGTQGSCQGVIFILVLASFAVLCYTVLLTFYFLQRVKYSLSSQDFKQKYEVKMHVLIWVIAFSLAFFGLIRKNYTSGDIFGEPLCTICDSGQHQHFLTDTIIIVVMPMVFTFVSLIVILAQLTSYVHNKERLIQPSFDTNQSSTDTHATPNSAAATEINPASEGPDDEEEPYSDSLRNLRCRRYSSSQQGQPTNKGQRQRGLGSIAKESLVQSILYVLAFTACYIFPVVLYFISSTMSGEGMQIVIFVASSIFWPLGGFFNILVYSRPKIKKFRRLNPEYINFPWIFIFLAVVCSGGESPEVDCQDQDQYSGLRVGRRDGVVESEAFGNIIEVQPTPFGCTATKRDDEPKSHYTTPFVNYLPLAHIPSQIDVTTSLEAKEGLEKIEAIQNSLEANEGLEKNPQKT